MTNLTPNQRLILDQALALMARQITACRVATKANKPQAEIYKTVRDLADSAREMAKTIKPAPEPESKEEEK